MKKKQCEDNAESFNELWEYLHMVDCCVSYFDCLCITFGFKFVFSSSLMSSRTYRQVFNNSSHVLYFILCAI